MQHPVSPTVRAYGASVVSETVFHSLIVLDPSSGRRKNDALLRCPDSRLAPMILGDGPNTNRFRYVWASLNCKYARRTMNARA